MFFSAVGSVAGFLSAPGATDRGRYFCARAAGALRLGVGVAHPAFRQRAARDRAQPDEARDGRGARHPPAPARALPGGAERVGGGALGGIRGRHHHRLRRQVLAQRLALALSGAPGLELLGEQLLEVRRQRHRRQRETRGARERLDRDLQRLHGRESIVGLGRQRAQHDLRQRGRDRRPSPRARPAGWPVRLRSGSGCPARWRPRTARCPSSARRGSRPARRCRCAGRRAGRGTARATCTRTFPSASLPAYACAETPTSRCRSRRPSRRRRTRPARSTARRRGARCPSGSPPGPSRSCA